MEKTIINELQQVISKILVLSKKKKSMWIDYDEEADVLYVSFQKPQQATDTEIVDDNFLIRKRENEIVGVTVLHASKQG